MPPSLYRLTPREREVADLMLLGRTTIDAARELGMSVATCRAHVRSIARKLPNPYGLPAIRLIRSLAPVALVTEPTPESRAATFWAAATERPRPP